MPDASLRDVGCGKPVEGVSTPFGRVQQHESPCVLDVGHKGPCAVCRGDEPAYVEELQPAFGPWDAAAEGIENSWGDDE